MCKYLFSTHSGQCTALDFCAKVTVTSTDILSSWLEENMVNSATQLLLYPRIASSASSEGDGEIGDFVSFLAFCCWAHIWVTAQVRADSGLF